MTGGGGEGGVCLATVELYDPPAGTFAIAATSLPEVQCGHTATLLPSGKVLIIGSGAAGLHLLYDPASGLFTETAGGLATPRAEHTATLVAGGDVLVTGGTGSLVWTSLASAELFTPTTGGFTSVGSMSIARGSRHTATLLRSGKVLVVGGGDSDTNGWTTLATAELYDPATRAWSPTGSLATPRMSHTATLLASGKVLVTGGWSDGSQNNLASAELYDPDSGTFTSTSGSMMQVRWEHSATLLGSGEVLIAGGGPGDTPTCELYDPTSDSFSATATMSSGRRLHTATRLPTGIVLVAGGYDYGSRSLGSAERYWPPGLPEGVMVVSPTLLDFGDAVLGGEYTKSFTIRNAGTGPLAVKDLTLAEDRTQGAYALAGPTAPFSIGPGGSATIAVWLRPNDQNRPTGAIAIHSDDPHPASADVTVDLFAHASCCPQLGICVVDPAGAADGGAEPECIVTGSGAPLVDFGTVPYGGSAERVVTLADIGDGNLPIAVTKITLDSTAPFVTVTLFEVVDDPTSPGQRIEQPTQLPFYLSRGDPLATPPIPPTELRAHVTLSALGRSGDLPHVAVLVSHLTAGSPTLVPIVGHINQDDAGAPPAPDDGGPQPDAAGPPSSSSPAAGCGCGAAPGRVPVGVLGAVLLGLAVAGRRGRRPLS